MGEVCRRLRGGGCAHLHVCVHICADDKGNCMSLSKKKSSPQVFFYVSFWFRTHTEPTPTKPQTLESLGRPTTSTEVSQYAPIHHDIKNILAKDAWWLVSPSGNLIIKDLIPLTASVAICLGTRSNWTE